MNRGERFVLEWPDTGKLDVRLHGVHGASLRYSPAKAAVKKALSRGRRGAHKARFIADILQHQRKEK